MEKIIMEETENKNVNRTKRVNEVATSWPLSTERIFVRFVPRKSGGLTDNPHHVLYGGLADGAVISLCVPVLRSTGSYKNVLTNEEKTILEKELSMDYNALSVYRPDNNFWESYKVNLTKEGLHLDLSNPEDYIKYKVLLANSDIVAPSVQARLDRPKNTYRFELVSEKDETSLENAKVNATVESYKQFGKIEDDFDTMRILVELIDGRPYDRKSSLAFFKSRVINLIQADAKNFLRHITDPLLHAKVLLRRGVELGKVTTRNDVYYLVSTNAPLCDNGENATLSVAARYISEPAHQDIKFILESEVDKNKGK